jgi:HAD superfamily hydrolase (TIGR01509 family)
MIFDLDGTLVQAEKLKAMSYARAAVELSPQTLTEEDVFRVFRDVVGLPRRDVAQAILDRFRLKEAARSRMKKYGVREPWQAFVQVRLHHYDRMLEDSGIIRRFQWPHNVKLLEMAHATGCKLGLATHTGCRQTHHILEVLGLEDRFDFVATQDDVDHGKPDPEIYLLVSNQLDVPPGDCLVIEDSPSGVKAALAARMWCIAVTTPFTRERMHAKSRLEERWIVDDPDELETVLREMIAERMGDQTAKRKTAKAKRKTKSGKRKTAKRAS